MANSDNRYEMLPLRELSKLSWVVGVDQSTAVYQVYR